MISQDQPERRRRLIHRALCKKIGLPALTAKDKLSLEGVGIILTLLIAVASSVVWMENRYASKDDIRSLRCDMYMLQLYELRGDTKQKVLDRIERRWEQRCAGENFREVS